MVRKLPQIFIFGYYGAGNIGDELILSGLLKLIPAGVRPLVCSRDPDGTRALHSVAAVKFSLFNWPCLILEISKSRQIIIGGGDLLQETTSRRSLPAVYLIYKAARLFKKPVFLLGISAAPGVSGFGRRAVAEMIRGAQLVATRGDDTYKYFREIAGGRPEIVSGVDLSFARPPEPDLQPKIFPRDFPEQKIIGVSVRDWFEAEAVKFRKLKDLAAALEKLMENERVKLVFLPFQFDRDRAIENNILKHLKNLDRVVTFDRPLTPDDMAAAVKGVEAIIGMRLHSLILGFMLGKTVFSLSYSPKNSELMRQIGRPGQELLLSDLNIQKIESLLNQLILVLKR